MHPQEALHRIAFLLETDLAPRYRITAFRNAERVIADLPDEELRIRAKSGRLGDLTGIGAVTEQVIVQALAEEVPAYLQALETERQERPETGTKLLSAIKGDCHTHSDYSDGWSSIELMARTARSLGREYMVLTDHSPNLKVANGLTTERLIAEIDELAEVNSRLEMEARDGRSAFRILTGIEVDILEDGTLDQSPDVLERLDIVVGSVHSKLRMEKNTMTKRMLKAITDPNLDILGHCTGRLIPQHSSVSSDKRDRQRRERPQSEFDAPAIFEACKANNVAVEINCRPERKDPPMELLRMASAAGCRFSIDTDAHAPGQLDWLWIGCERAELAEIEADRVINTLSAEGIVEWTLTD